MKPLPGTNLAGPLKLARAINGNSLADTIIPGFPIAGYIIDRLILKNFSGVPAALLAITLRDAAAGAGNSLVGSVGGLNVIVTATSLAAIAYPLSAALGASRILTGESLYLRVGTANGVALTFDAIITYVPFN